MKREELEIYELTDGNTRAYDKDEADSVMDAMEKDYEANRKLWEAEIASLKAIAEKQQKLSMDRCFEIKALKQRIKELEADKLRQENYCESLVNDNTRLNEIIISKDMVGAELHNENKDLRHNLEDWKAENEALKARIKELEASQPKWISVKDRLPKEDDEILFTNGEFIYKGCWTTWDGGCSDFSYVVGSGFVDEVNDESFTEEQITHWMPLPSVPTTEKSTAVQPPKSED